MVSIVTSVGADGSQPTKQFLHTTETDMVYRLDASDYKQYDSVHDLMIESTNGRLCIRESRSDDFD